MSREQPDPQIDSPGNGISPIRLSRDPLATEGEATPGPDDYNPYQDPDADDDDLPESVGGIPALDEPEKQPPLLLGGPPGLADSDGWIDVDWPDFLD